MVWCFVMGIRSGGWMGGRAVGTGGKMPWRASGWLGTNHSVKARELILIDCCRIWEQRHSRSIADLVAQCQYRSTPKNQKSWTGSSLPHSVFQALPCCCYEDVSSIVLRVEFAHGEESCGSMIGSLWRRTLTSCCGSWRHDP